AHDWRSATQALWKQWEELSLGAVVTTSPLPLVSRASRLFSQLGLGRAVGAPVTELLDATPLAKLLQKGLDFRKLRDNISAGHLHGLGLTTTHYATGSSVT